MKAKRLLCFALCLVMLVAVFAGCNVVETPDGVEETTTKAPAPVKKPATTVEETSAVEETESEEAGNEDTSAEENVGGDESATVGETENATANTTAADTTAKPGSNDGTTADAEVTTSVNTTKPGVGTEETTNEETPTVGEVVPGETENEVETNAEEATVAGTVAPEVTTKPATTTKPAVTTKPEETTNSDSGNNDEPIGNTGIQGSSQAEIDAALAKIDSYNKDFSSETFNILCREGLEKSFFVQETTGEPLEDAVFTRNSVFYETYGVEILTTKMSANGLLDHFKADIKSSHEYDVMFAHTSWNIDLAAQGYLYNFLDLEPYIDLSKSWWDEGTKSFNIANSIWFMNGSFNYDDDATTYCLMFNKEIAANYFQADDIFYSLVNGGKWTLDNFYSYAQKASKNIGAAEWDEKDQYGFVTTWEYGTTFFYGSGLNYVKCEEGKNPVITLDANSIRKATELLGKLNVLYATEVTYWPEGGQEQVGKEIFWGGRCLFFGEIVENVVESNKKMEADFGVLPVPKYDEKQATHISWTHGISSSMVIASHVEDAEKFGLLLEAFNVLSEQYVRPAYYDVVLTRKSVQDADSKPMLDIIFKGRTYDLAMYYDALGLVNAFKNCVNQGKTGFAQEYAKVKTSANSQINKLVRSFQKLSKG